MTRHFTGAGRLLRTELAQNRRSLGPWLILIPTLSASSVLAYRWMFPSRADRQGLATALGSNPALDLVFGPARDLMTNDGFNAWRAGQLGSLFAALMAILLVISTSRADEESGRAELVAAAAISRQARLIASMGVAFVASIALVIVTFVLTWACGGGVRATAILSAGYGGIALVFAGVAGIAAQLGGDARTASGLSMSVLGVLYVLRGWCDSSGTAAWTQWLTPFGWLERTAPATANDPWPLLTCPLLAVALVVMALVLQQRRDFGMGLLSPGAGPASSPRLGVGGLAWRLHRGSLAAWAAAFLLLGIMFGNLTTSIGSVFATNPSVARILASGAATPGQLTFGFVSTILQIAGIVAAIMGAQVVMRLHTEEVTHRSDPLLAGSLRRRSLFATHAALALAADAVMMLLNGVAVATVASHGAHGVAFRTVVEQAGVTVPAIWLLTGVSIAAVGAYPRGRMSGWMVIVATFGITLLGPTFRLPNWMMDFSPLHHVPAVAQPHSWSGEWALIAITMLLVLIGCAGFSRRDLE